MDLDELVFHPWTVQGPRNVLTLVRGSGSYVMDGDDRRYESARAAGCEWRRSSVAETHGKD